ncbi:MAG: hypothetical protein ACFFCO_11355 [Promethearchaeota archaeon]
MSTEPARLSVKTTRVIVFKDGYCMFVKKAHGKLDSAARATIDTIPEGMVLGTFWAIPEKGKSATVVAKQQTVTRKARQETEKQLVLEFDQVMARKTVEVVLIYYGPGLRWIPTYRLDLKAEGQCHIMMQAEVLNEAEDLDEVPMDLVVGVPNFRYRDIISPLSLVAALQNPLAAAAPQVMGQLAVSNVLMSQRLEERPRGGEVRGSGSELGDPSMGPLPDELGGEGAQDLFLYKIPSIKLRAGERAAIPLVSAEQAFRHIYSWQVHLSRSNVDTLPGSRTHISPIKLSRNEVWHQIEMVNKTNVPWTTGPALIMEEYLPLAQELMTYTAIGGTVRIPLSVAIDVRGTFIEKETRREPDAIEFDRTQYARITKEGTLTVKNYKQEAIDLIITCELGGNADEASQDGQITISDYQNSDWTQHRGAVALTGHSTITWTLRLEPGETKELTCKYHYYIR